MRKHKNLILFIMLFIVTLLGMTVLRKDNTKADVSDTNDVVLPQEEILPDCVSPELLRKKLSYQDWLDDLAMCESSNRDWIVILDKNNKYSYSCLQFQRETWDHYTQRYGLTHLDIMNCDHQKELANTMLEESYSKWRHWYKCSTDADKIGLPYR